MPLFVEAVDPSKRGREVFGPYPESDLLDTLTFARIGSKRGDSPREVVWVCKGRQPVRLRTYVSGRKVQDQSDAGFDRLRDCIERSGAACAVRRPKPPARSKLAPLPDTLTCPAGGSSQSIEGLSQTDPRRAARGAAIAVGGLSLGWLIGHVLTAVRPER